MPQEILRNTMGDRSVDRNLAVDVNQTIKKGDPIVLAAGLAQKGAIGATAILGFAEHDVTTGGTVTARDRVIVAIATPTAEFKGELKTASGAATAALRGTDAGFIVEDGIYKVDTAAVAKQLRIIDVAEGGNAANIVEFKVLAANRAES